MDLKYASVLVFANGKVVIAGLKSQVSLKTAADVLANLSIIIQSN
jgi:TATA-box binding protein (TBP) (component of TFIID and TFIIIB)